MSLELSTLYKLYFLLLNLFDIVIQMFYLLTITFYNEVKYTVAIIFFTQT